MECSFSAAQNEAEEEEEGERKNDQKSFPRYSLSQVGRYFFARKINEVHKGRIMIIVVDAVKEL